jgi:hypothetical protein
VNNLKKNATCFFKNYASPTKKIYSGSHIYSKICLVFNVNRDGSVVASSATQTCQQEDAGSNLGLSGGLFPHRHELKHIRAVGKYSPSLAATHQSEYFFYKKRLSHQNLILLLM